MAAERDMGGLNDAMGRLREQMDGGKKPSQATRLVELVRSSAVELWHDTDGEPWATVEVDGHHEHWSLASRGFRRWAMRVFFESEGTTPSSSSVKDALGVLEGLAVHTGHQHPVYTRVAADLDGTVTYLDLCDPEWRAVRLTADGWEVVARPPVRFQRRKGNLPLPVPARGGDLNALRSFLNLPSDDDWRLYVACLVSALRPKGPYVVTNMRGEQGSGKTTSGRIFRRLVDPNTAPLRSQPRDDRDMAIAAKNGWMVAYDNLSHLPDWLSDGLCRMATGGGFGTRELYTNDEEALFDYMRPVLLNGIESVVTRGDLRDREVTIDHPVIAKAKRRVERELWERFEREMPAIFGGLLAVYCGAVRELPAVKLAELPRMADFATFGVATERALGWPAGTFMRAYQDNRAAANSTALDESLIAPLVREIARGAGFEGTASLLLSRLESMVTEDARRDKRWPKSPRALGGQLRRLAPDLRSESWAAVDFEHTKRGTIVAIRLPANPSSESAADFPSPVSFASPGTQEGDANASPGDANAAPGDAKKDGDQAGFEFRSRPGDAGDGVDGKSAIPSDEAPGLATTEAGATANETRPGWEPTIIDGREVFEP